MAFLEFHDATMIRCKIYPFLLILLVGFAVLPQLNAHLIEVDLGTDDVTAEYDLFLSQNFTVFPDQAIIVDQNGLEEISPILEEAVQDRNPEAKISNLRMQVISSEESVNLKFSFHVNGITEKRGNTILFDCSWKSFTVSDDLTVQNVHINRFGEAYIRPVLEPHLPTSSLRVVVNGTRQMLPQEGVNVLGNLTIFNFASYSPPIGLWEKAFSLENKTTVWSLRPDPLINVTATYFEGNISKRHYAVLDHAMRVIAPGMAGVEGDKVKTNLGLPSYEIAFSAIIILTLAFSIVFYVLKRRAKKKIAKKRR